MTSTRPLVELALKQNWSRLYGYACALAGDADAARDLLQQCAVNALANDNAPAELATLRAWLFKIIRNIWIDRFRQEKIRVDSEPALRMDEAAWGYDDRVIAEITVKQGLERIEPAFREIIELVDLWGLKYTDVAVVLDIPVGTVMSRLSRARLMLLDAIAEGNLRYLKSTRALRK